MKRCFLIAPFFLATVAIFAQIPVALDRMEGRWISGNTISDWTFTDDYALNNRTYQVMKGDTSEISSVYIRADKSGTTTLTYITPHGDNYQFRLAVADVYGSTWRNVQEDGLPTCLRIERSGPSKYTWAGLGETMEYKREKEGHIRFKLGALMGVNSSIFPKRPYVDKEHGPMAGFESALSLHISRTNSPFGVNLETGYMQLNNTVERTVQGNNLQSYTYKGEEQTTMMYAGIIPEGRFGKKEQFLFSTGLMMTFAPKRTFQGDFINNSPPSQEANLLPAATTPLKSQLGLVLGFGYQPDFKIANIKPVFYCRMVYKTAVSAGMKITF